MKILKRLLLFIVLAALLAASFYFFYMRPRHVVPILMYHSISAQPESSLNVSPENFTRQMDFLKREGYSVISLDELVSGIKSGRKFSSKTVVITFDDGFENNYLYAFPVLAKYKMPATVFLITGYLEKEKGYLTWDQVRLMYENGIDFGCHTRDNVYLPSVKDGESLWIQIEGSKADIKDNAGKEAGYFCYPTGGFNDIVKDVVKKAGYKGACTTNRGSDRYNKDVYELIRVKITNSDTTKPLHFRAKLSGYYNLFRSLKRSE
jgi:peptidoglycan/xylan/chitin deacetylase (PgdA/CDA1 family)